MSTTEQTTTIGESDAQAAVIHTEDLTKVYPGTDFAAVDRLNLDVRAGEIFGLLGPNGAGKTTTAGMLTTRVVPTSGRALLAGIDVAAHPALAGGACCPRLACGWSAALAHGLGQAREDVGGGLPAHAAVRDA